ncbi:unnamed protein product [Leuciscus chuanchicus]
MELTVKLLNGDVKRLVVNGDTTVGELKKLISQNFNEPPHKQKLSIVNGHRISLEDDSRTLSSYGLHSGSVVNLLITNPAPFQVFVKNEKGQTKTYEVDVDETVDQLQTKIYRKDSVPKDQQRLIYNGRQLEAAMKLQDYDITSGSTIHMTLRLRGETHSLSVTYNTYSRKQFSESRSSLFAEPNSIMELTVKLLNGDVKRLVVNGDTTVGELKKLICQNFNEPPHKQKLSIVNGHRINLEDDSRTLSSYGLHSGSVVNLLITNPAPFQVFVKNEKGQTKTYEVDVNETVDQLQTKIYRKDSVPKDQQRLIYNGRQLEAAMKLQDYDITSGSTIHMTLRLRGG